MSNTKQFDYTSFPKKMNADYITDYIIKFKNQDKELIEIRRHISINFYKHFNVQNVQTYDVLSRGIDIEIQRHIKSYKNLFIISDELEQCGFHLKYGVYKQIGYGQQMYIFNRNELDVLDVLPSYIIISIGKV